MGDTYNISVSEEQPISVSLTSAVSARVGGQPFHFQDVRAADDDYVHIGIVGTGALQVITAGITNPDVARNASVTATNIDTPSGVVTIVGINSKGVAATESITIIPGTTAYGNVAWATISSVTLPAGVSALDTIKIGISNKLGLGVTIGLATNIIKMKVNDEDKSSEIAGNVDLTYDTVNCAVIDAHADITIWTKERYV